MFFHRLFKKAQNDDKGFTLVEIIVTLAVFSIILVVAGNYLFFGNRMFAETEVKNTEKSIGDNVFKYMERKIVYATKLEVINKDLNPQPEPKYNQKMYIGTSDDEGDLILAKRSDSKSTYNETNLFGRDYYGDYSVSYTVKVLDDTRINLNVTVKDSGKDDILYSTGEVIKNLNLVNSNSKITQIGSNNETKENGFVDPIISFDTEAELTAIYSPIELLEQMKFTRDQLLDKKMPDKYDQILNNNLYLDNDRIRAYVSQYYYHGEPYISSPPKTIVVENFPNFEGFPDTVVTNVDKKIAKRAEELGITNYKTLEKFLETPNLKMQGFCCTSASSPKDLSCYVYVSDRTGWNNVSLVYDHDEDNWYYGFKKGSSQAGLGIAQMPWETQTVNGTEYIGVKNYIQARNVDKITSAVNDEAWIKIEE